MTQKEMDNRQYRANGLKVYQIFPNQFFVESSDKRKMYKVALGEKNICTCEDFCLNKENDPEWNCKHIVAIQKANGNLIDFTQNNKDKANSTKENGNGRYSHIPPEFLVTLKGNEFILYKGLLDLAHKRGLRKLNVEVIQFPTTENKYEAIAKAIAESSNGEIFEDVGDANPKNVNSMITPHLLRMASTRAKARVLRDMVNVGICSVEELGDIEPEPREGKFEKEGIKESPVVPFKKPKDSSSPPDQMPQKLSQIIPAILSDAQLKAILNIAKRKDIGEDKIHQMAEERFGVKFHKISPTDASFFIQEIQSL